MQIEEKHADSCVFVIQGELMPRIICETPYISLVEGNMGVVYVKMDDGVLIVPITADGDIFFIQEYSPAFDRPILSVPAGIIERGEDGKEAANRELQEEIGYRAANIEYVGELRMNAKYVDAKHYVYLARDLSESKLQGDEPWEITTVRVPLEQVDDLIASGRLVDAMVIAAVYLAKRALSK